jgi:hypothetical protein
LLVGAHDGGSVNTLEPTRSVWSFRHTIATEPPWLLASRIGLSTEIIEVLPAYRHHPVLIHK